MNRPDRWARQPRSSRRAAALLVVACLAVGAMAALTGCSGGAAALSSLEIVPTTVPVPTPLASALQPLIGDPESKFLAAYGPPYQHLPEEDVYFTDSSHLIAIGVFPSNGVVVHIFVSGSQAWSYQQTFAACKLFLPSDAKEFSTGGTGTNPITNFTSSIGEISLANHDQGACDLYLGGH